jgi:ribosomal protein L30/L7E
MKKAILFCSLLLAVASYSNTASAQILKKLVSSVKGDNAAASTTGAPTNLEIGTALKQALEQGTGKSSDQLSAVDGFFGNALVKIVFPPEAQKAEKTLRSLGLNKLCDDVILSLNRAAEGAAKEAKPIFIDAIKQMTLQDVTNILLGKQDDATDYFKRTTTQQLSAKFKPVIQVSLDKAGATKYYTTAATTFNKVPFVKKINPDISDYVTQKAIDGLFVEIAQEELNIRKNLPSTRTTAVMQKVFSFADKMKK